MTYESKMGLGLGTMATTMFGGGAAANGGSSLPMLTFMTPKPGPLTETLVATGIRPLIPAGYVPLAPADRDWYMRWLAVYDNAAKTRHARKDAGFTYADPEMLARFLNAKKQVERLIRGRIPLQDLAVGTGGVPLVGTKLKEAKDYRQQLIAFWSKCNKSGGSAWFTGPDTISTLKMPLNLVREYPKTPVGLLKLRQALDSRRCPALATRRRLFGLLPDAEKTTAAKLLYAYAQEKEAVLEQSALSEREKAAAKAAEVEAAEKQAQEAQQRADAAAERAAAAERESSELQNTMSDLEARLAEANAALQAMANAPTPATADVAAMQNAVAQLTGQLAETRAQADVSQAQALLSRQEEEELQHEADLADQAAAIEGGFLSRYKWHLMGVGGLALVGAGLWYYFKKYKPAQAAAAGGIAANPDDEEEVFFNGELVGYVGPSAIEGRWVARSVLFDRPTYSALKKARAENWLKELARG